MYAKSPRIVQRGQSVVQSKAGWFGVLMDFIIECKITPEIFHIDEN